jgi:hypothetical protein
MNFDWLTGKKPNTQNGSTTPNNATPTASSSSSNSSLLADPSSVGAVFLGDLNAEPQEEAMMYLRGAKADPIEHIHTSRLKVNIIRHSFFSQYYN